MRSVRQEVVVFDLVLRAQIEAGVVLETIDVVRLDSVAVLRDSYVEALLHDPANVLRSDIQPALARPIDELLAVILGRELAGVLRPSSRLPAEK